MDSDFPLDCAIFQLSPRRTRCDLFVSASARKTEHIASGFVKQFATHLKALEEQTAAQSSIRLHVERRGNAGAAWFNKGTLERFARFVNTPEVLELVGTLDAEMTQLECARKIYLQGTEDCSGDVAGEAPLGSAASADLTKKELLRAIDLRLAAVKKDLVTTCNKASTAGFNIDNVTELMLFANHFGSYRLSEACKRFISLCKQRPDFIIQQQASPSPSPHWSGFDGGNLRCSSSSDMSIDGSEGELRKELQESLYSSQERFGNCKDPTEVQPISSKGETYGLKSSVDKPTEIKSTSVLSAPEAEETNGSRPRRLSVQDKIKMFESKQKELATGSASTSSGVLSRTGSIKGEHRRVPSNSSLEKSLSRRWSGVSDMSIDLNNSDCNSLSERKESGTPTSVNVEDQSKNDGEEIAGWKDTATSKSLIGSNDCVDNTFTSFSSEAVDTKMSLPSSISAPAISSDQIQVLHMEPGNNQMQSSGAILQHSGTTPHAFQKHLKNLEASNIPMLAKGNIICPAPLTIEQTGRPERESSEVSSSSISTTYKPSAQKIRKNLPSKHMEVSLEAEVTRTNNQASQFSVKKAADVNRESEKRPESSMQAQTLLRMDFKSLRQGQASSGIEVNCAENAFPNIRSQRNNRKEKVDEAAGKDLCMMETTSYSFKVSEESAGADIVNDSELCTQQNGGMLSTGKKAKVGKMAKPTTKVLSEQSRMMRTSKGNQELNDELQMKASELEKLFAAHKLRVHNDQINATRRGKATDVLVDKADDIPLKVLDQLHPGELAAEKPEVGFDANLFSKMVDSEDYNGITEQQMDNFCLPEESRGKFYDKYKQRREEKLKEDWKAKGKQKEATMKAMHDSLELSRAEMMAKFSGSATLRDSQSLSSRAKRYFSYHSDLQEHEQKEECLLREGEIFDQIDNGDQDKFFCDNLSGDCSFMSSDSRKHASGKTLLIPRPMRITASGSTTYRTLPENPIAQSVPNFTDFRKENTKPLPSVTRVARVQPKSFHRSKSISKEATGLLKDDKPQRTQSMRKSLVGTDELKDFSGVKVDGFSLTTSRISTDQADQDSTHRTYKAIPAKPSTRKGIKSSVVSLVSEHENAGVSGIFGKTNTKEFVDPLEDSSDEGRDADESEKMSTEENMKKGDFHGDSDSENVLVTRGFTNSDSHASENGNALHVREAVKDVTLSRLPELLGNMNEMPGESPLSCHSHLSHLFPYGHEADDAFVDSSTESQGSSTFHPLNQINEADSARMRKKWGNTQVSILGANPSHHSRKDATKGFKRLLKFGKKNRGFDIPVNDWVSSTASEGDDDTEDGRDLASATSDDLKKSRMGNCIHFNENELFQYQGQSLNTFADHLNANSMKAPRSFFSLSSFRNKGNESKLR